MIKKLCILIAVLLAFATSASAQTSKIEEQKRVIANLEKSIAQEEKQLAKLKKSKASAEQQIVALTRQIEQRNKLISETTRQIKQLTAEVAASERRLKQLGGQLNGLEESVAEIVRAAYRNYRRNFAFCILHFAFNYMPPTMWFKAGKNGAGWPFLHRRCTSVLR